MALEPDPYALDLEETRALEEDRIILNSPENGKRKVSATILTPPSSQGSQSSLNFSSSASVRARPFDPSTKAPFDLPERVESIASLEFLGFTRKVAEDIFGRWAARPDSRQNPDGLLQYALAELGKLNYQPLRDLPAPQAMAGLGISDELQAALTDPHFSQLFLSQTLRYWLEDTMNTRYSTLNKLLERLKFHAVRAVVKRKEKKKPKVAGVFESTVSSSSSQQPPAITASSTITSEQEGLPTTYTTVQAAPPALPDHYIFYKGKAVGDITNPLFIRENGSVDMNTIRIHGGGDFNHSEDAWYWTREEATADKYRRWDETRSPYSETWIIQIQVPKKFIDTLRKEQMWYSPDWKEYVWYCRKGTSVEDGDPPPKFDKFWKPGQAQFVEGHICGRAPAQIPRIEKEEVQQRFSERDVLHTEGTKATQSVFMDKEVVKRLAIEFRGKIHIEIHPALAPPERA